MFGRGPLTGARGQSPGRLEQMAAAPGLGAPGLGAKVFLVVGMGGIFVWALMMYDLAGHKFEQGAQGRFREAES